MLRTNRYFLLWMGPLMALAAVLDAQAVGEPVNGFPKWEERVIHQWTNRARSDPVFEMNACVAQFGAARCGERACYSVKPPLSYNLNLNRAARFHSDEMRLQGYFNHPSQCAVVPNINALYPATCDGSAGCACTAGAPTDTFARVALFGSSGTGEIIASSTDPNSAFYQWLFEPSSDPACSFSLVNGHRFLILTQNGSMGAGMSGPTVGEFGPGAAPQKIPSGSHYPRQSAAVQVWANWFDTSGPSVARVNVDGTCTPMTLGRGTQANGAWTTTLNNVASGCRRYYFEFKDSGGNAVTFPTTGSLGIGPAASCADWDIARPLTCDAPPTFTLTVNRAGGGTGSVTSMPAGINCGGDCSEAYVAATPVTLTAAPLAGSVFAGWSGGGCAGTGTCAINMNAAATVTATFLPIVVPGAPVLLSATPGNGQASIAFSPPLSDGGSAISGYTAQCIGTPTVSMTGTASPIVVAGLTNGNAYDCGVFATNVVGNGAVSGRLLVTPNTGSPLALTGVHSRKLHLLLPARDLPVDPAQPATGAVSIEPRIAGAGHLLVFQFNAAVFSAGSVVATDSVSGPIAGVVTQVSGNEVTVPLAGLPDRRRITVTLTNVNGAGVNARATVGFLMGDVGGTGAVTAADAAAVKSLNLATVNAANFRFDLNLSGIIDAADLAVVRTQSGRVLP